MRVFRTSFRPKKERQETNKETKIPLTEKDFRLVQNLNRKW